MTTITEDYVSFETAKLLKEKGFGIEEETCGYYPIKGDATGRLMFGAKYHHNTSQVQIAAPTLQMTMKWLREVHNIFICIIPSEVGAGVMDYTYVFYKIDAKNFYFEDLGIQGRANNISKISYKETCETAIKYCLENLI